MEEFFIANWPALSGSGVVVVAAVYAVIKKYRKKTKTKIDDRIVDFAEKTGIGAYLDRFNPFK